jgi:peptidoglycan/LPS O-acetylase OafA/YrhL
MCNFHQMQSETMHDIVWMVLFVSTVLMMTSASGNLRKALENRVFGWLGERSYSLYALHFPLIYMVFAVITAAGARGAAADGWLLLAGLPLSLLISNVGYRYLEIPALRRARAVGQPMRS